MTGRSWSRWVLRLLVLVLPLVVVGTFLSARAAPSAPLAQPEQARAATSAAAVSRAVGVSAVTPAVAAVAAASSDDAINRVLAVSIDGLNPQAITRLGPSGAPTFYRLMREGAYTLNARTAREQTRTLPNHTTMLTGRRIGGSHGHGVTFNSDKRRTTVHKASPARYVSSVFDVVHDRGGRTALYSSKTKFRLYQRTWNTHGARDRVGRNNGRAKIDRVVIDTDNARLVARLNAQLRSASPGTFTFLHISLPDNAGHEYGFMGSRYLAAVKRSDQLLGTVLNTIAARPALRRETLVLVTADHGGSGGSHSNEHKLANYRVPFFAWGPGVAAGRNLYTLNPSRRSPGTARTSYSGRQPVRNGDLANLATDVLDLPRVPGSRINRSRSLTVFPR